MTGQTYAEGAQAPVIIISDEDGRGSDAYRFLAESGFRAGRPERLEDFRAERIDAPLWVELASRDPGAVDGWLADLNDALAETPATIVLTPQLLDVAVARLDGSHVELLIDPDDIERATAAGLMRARMDSRAREINDAGDKAQLRQLSEEVARIASSLARLTGDSAAVSPPAPGPSEKPSGDAPAVSAETVRQAIRARRLREDYFEAELFADPAWDMLLDLLAAEIAQHRVPVSSLCSAASVPPTTALRWMKAMTDKGLFQRVPDPHDGRRIFIELSSDASLAMRQYFSALQGRLAA